MLVKVNSIDTIKNKVKVSQLDISQCTYEIVPNRIPKYVQKEINALDIKISELRWTIYDD